MTFTLQLNVERALRENHSIDVHWENKRIVHIRNIEPFNSCIEFPETAMVVEQKVQMQEVKCGRGCGIRGGSLEEMKICGSSHHREIDEIDDNDLVHLQYHSGENVGQNIRRLDGS